MPTYTYDEDQTANADQVKYYANQRGTTAATRDFSDEEIAAVLSRATHATDKAKVYWTAAELLTTLLIKYGAEGGGIESRQISKLRVVYGGRSTKLETLVAMRDRYVKLAAKYSRTKPRAARLINASGVRV